LNTDQFFIIEDTSFNIEGEEEKTKETEIDEWSQEITKGVSNPTSEIQNEFMKKSNSTENLCP
jgi:hypothetical protein